MFYYSKKAKQKVVHTKRCCHLMHTPKEYIGCFSNAEKANNAGYRLCKDCGPLEKYFARKKDKIANSANKMTLNMNLKVMYFHWKHLIPVGK